MGVKSHVVWKGGPWRISGWNRSKLNLHIDWITFTILITIWEDLPSLDKIDFGGVKNAAVNFNYLWILISSRAEILCEVQSLQGGGLLKLYVGTVIIVSVPKCTSNL